MCELKDIACDVCGKGMLTDFEFEASDVVWLCDYCFKHVVWRPNGEK